jgi:hypothetical protein
MDTFNEPHLPGGSKQLKFYWAECYRILRKYSATAWCIISDRYWGNSFEQDDACPRLAPALKDKPGVTGILVDVHIYTKGHFNVTPEKRAKMNQAQIIEQQKINHIPKIQTLREHWATFVGEFSAQVDNSVPKTMAEHKEYMRMLKFLCMDMANGGVYYQWKCSYDGWVKFHLWSFKSIEKEGFNEIY